MQTGECLDTLWIIALGVTLIWQINPSPWFKFSFCLEKLVRKAKVGSSVYHHYGIRHCQGIITWTEKMYINQWETLWSYYNKYKFDKGITFCKCMIKCTLPKRWNQTPPPPSSFLVNFHSFIHAKRGGGGGTMKRIQPLQVLTWLTTFSHDFSSSVSKYYKQASVNHERSPLRSFSRFLLLLKLVCI